MLGTGDFLGEGCLAGQPVRMGSATAITGSTVLLVDKDQMVRLLHKQHSLSDRFIAHMLARYIRIEETSSTSSSTPAKSGLPGRSCFSHRTASRANRSKASRRTRRRPL